MPKPTKSTVEERFAKRKRQDEQFVKEREIMYKKSAEKTARLRALRLAKEAADTNVTALGVAAGKRKRSA